MVTRKKIVFGKDGKKVYEGERAAPENLREDLRKMPGEYVTKDTSDPDKIHELDDPHVVEQYVADFERSQEEAEKPKDPIKSVRDAIKSNWNTEVFDQKNIDWCRFNICYNLLCGAIKMHEAGEYDPDHMTKIRHVWFPKPGYDEILMKEGNAPSDSDRPKHLKGKELYIDPLNWPKRCKKWLSANGWDVPNLQAMYMTTRQTPRLLDTPLNELPI